MCGIVGFIRIRDRSQHIEDKANVLRQIKTLWYRGSDARNVEIGSGVGFGHARLSIIDLFHGAVPQRTIAGAPVLSEEV